MLGWVLRYWDDGGVWFLRGWFWGDEPGLRRRRLRRKKNKRRASVKCQLTTRLYYIWQVDLCYGCD